MSHPEGERRRLERQEKVVAALWEFGRAVKRDAGTVSENCTRCDDGTKMNLANIERALVDILDAFGQDIIEVQ